MRQGEVAALNEEDTALAALAAEKYSQAVEDSLDVAHKQQTDTTVGSHVRQAFQQVGHVVHRSAVSSGQHCVSVMRERSLSFPAGRRCLRLCVVTVASCVRQASQQFPTAGPGLQSRAAWWWLTSRVAMLLRAIMVGRRFSREPAVNAPSSANYRLSRQSLCPMSSSSSAVLKTQKAPSQAVHISSL